MEYKAKGNYFDGRYVLPLQKGPDAAEHFILKKCPADTNNVLWEMPVGHSHIPQVINSAVKGHHFWRGLSFEKRAVFLKRYQEQVVKKKKALAKAIALESGKPLWEAQGEVNAVIGKVDTTLQESLLRIQRQSFPEIMPGITGHLLFRPLGPCLVIGPFNFPCHLANTQILSALMAGNSIILKPSEKVAYSAELLIHCFHEANFPKGVINLIQGGGEMAQRLCRVKSIKGIYFTGSKEVGTSLIKNTCDDLSKLVALELGGKNAAIIHQDAVIENALAEILQGAFLTTGQRCTSTSLIIIHRSLVNEFVFRFHEMTKKIIIDHPIHHEKEPFMGPLIDQKALDEYLLFMGMAKRDGFEEVMRGKQLLDKKHPGYYVAPSIHFSPSVLNLQCHFFQSEIFGPNVTFVPYDDFEEAISMANATEYGLVASLFSKDRALLEKCYQEIDVGLLNFNRSTCGASPRLPFGGVKNSGNYRPMAVSAIDWTVSQMASLESQKAESSLKNIRGLFRPNPSEG